MLAGYSDHAACPDRYSSVGLFTPTFTPGDLSAGWFRQVLEILAVPRGQRKLCPIKRVARFHRHNSTIEAQCVFSSLATLIAVRSRGLLID